MSVGERYMRLGILRRMPHHPVRVFMNVWSRKVHRWATVATALPLLVVVCSGILLLVKKQVEWIQPPTLATSADGEPALCMSTVLDAVRSDTNAGVETWRDIDRLDMRIRDNVIKVHAKSGWEVQICAITGTLLGSAIRRSDLVESIHDGSWFGSVAKLGIFLPSAVLVLVLWMTGVWLWLIPHINRMWREPAARRRT